MDMKWIAYVHDIAWTAADGTPLGGFAYTYDAAGNVTRIVRDGRPTLDLSWNGRYQLVSVSTNGVFAEGYAYDALGRRASTTTWEGTVRHVYDDNWQVIADLNSNGNVLRSYVWGEGIDRLLAVKVGAKSYAALTDVQGTVWGLADGTDVVARWMYDAWGNVPAATIDTRKIAPGAGPRHIVFHPNGRFAFVIFKLKNLVASYRYTGEGFEFIEIKDLLAKGFTDFSKAAAIKLSEDGSQLFCSNRGHDSITVFNVDAGTGKMAFLNNAKLGGQFPRDFAFFPGGKFCMVGLKESWRLASFAYDRAKGTFDLVASMEGVYRPLFFTFKTK